MAYAEVARAHDAVKSAIAAGVLARQPCEVCGATPTDAHHDDYAAPLEVRWLCRLHHRQWHVRHESLADTSDAPSRTIRVGLTPAEWQAIQALSASSGVPITRLVADAIRDTLLKDADALVARSDADALDALTRALDRPPLSPPATAVAREYAMDGGDYS